MLAISNGKKANSSITAMCCRYSEVDPLISRHGEPHVVRVGVVCILGPAVYQKIFLISSGSYLSEEFEIVVGPPVAASTIDPSMDENLPSTGRDHIGNGE